MSVKTFSFDIFDTCLVRTCGLPVNVFDILAERILGKDSTKSLLTDFRLMRIEGEKQARKQLIKGNKEEVTLDEIYSFCDFSKITDIPKDKIKREELQVESDVLMPCREILDEVKGLHSRGISVVYISDMYLPKDFIKKALIDNGFYVDGDLLYVSSDIMLSKSTGNLYRYVKKELNIDYKSWLHKGDNDRSDVQVPKQLGIKVKKVYNGFAYYERLIQKHDISGCDNELSSFAGLIRSVRLSSETDEYSLFATTFIAPIYVSYVYCILKESQNKGLQHLYFIARDGYILYNIAKELQSAFPALDFHYFYASRKSLYLPGMKEATANEMQFMWTWTSNIDIDVLMDYLQLNDAAIKTRFKSLKGQQLLEAFFNDEEFKNKVNFNIRSSRELCIKYFEQEGITQGNCAIVDVAGTRKCQIAINRILKSYGKPTVYGFYLEALPQRIIGNDYSAFFYADRYGSNGNTLPIVPQNLFEQYFSLTNQDRTAAYKEENGKIIPIFESNPDNDCNKDKISEVNIKICKLFARKSVALGLNNWDNHIYNAADVYADFYKTPRIECLKAIFTAQWSGNKYGSSNFLVKCHPLVVFFLHNKPKWSRAQIMRNTVHPKIWLTIFRVIDFIRALKIDLKS